MVRKKGYFMELVLYKGRPADCSGRLEKEIRTYDLLDALGLEYWRTDHAFLRADTMEDCLLIERTLGARICKNLFLCNRQQTDFYLLMMPGDKPFKTKDLSPLLGCSRLSFAGPEHMERLLRTIPGSVSALELMFDTQAQVRLVIDRDLLKDRYLSGHPGISTSTPSRVFKGKRLPGHMGAVRVTVQNLSIVKVDAENNLIAIKGAIPGPKGSVVCVSDSVKA